MTDAPISEQATPDDPAEEVFDIPDPERDKSGRFVAGNTFGFSKGQSGNPDGRPPKAALLKELDAGLGEVPREMLYKILDQAQGGRRHFPVTTAVGKAIKRMSIFEIVQLATYLDEQSNGKAKARTELEGAVIMVSNSAYDL